LILATVGTHHQPFERFLRAALAMAAGSELIVQHGHTPRLPAGPSVHWHQWLAPGEMHALMCEAELVITHAGVASIVDAVHAGHRPIVVPRRAYLGEHVDDHQLQIVSALVDLDLVTALYDGIDPSSATRAAPVPKVTWPPSGVKALVRRAVFGA
jgi:UDP-N-acetylglucosamine transferase subunit ALG13